jgi:serine protease
MTVVGGGNEADAIAAYDYPLTLRKKYNQSGGQYGAFVVCTNASWGVDNTTAASAPLWCAMYDSLGSCGILNAGATINSNTNVDIVGDLPTSCPSDFLIAVTNTDNSDQKIANAGYGLQSIDLAAPGEGAFTVSTPNTYGAFNGTSAATPHVAGAIALLYSAPCMQLAYRAKADPVGTALLVKDFILRGVDTLAALQGITSSGGRLNIYKSMLLATQTSCLLTGCYQPFGLNTTAISDSSAHLYWSNVDSVLNGYFVRYRILGDTNWTNLTVTDSFADISNLIACTDYEWQVAADCGTITNFSASRIFRTANCCLPPSNIQLSRIMPDFVEFNWSFDANVVSSQVEFRIQGDTAWTLLTTNANSILINNLDSCTDYELRILSQCATNFNNRYSTIIPFRTSGCGACLDRTYCAAYTGDSDYEWISAVNLGQIQNVSASNNGYANFTGITSSLLKGQSYPVNLSMGINPSATANWRWKVWIDYNQDGILDDVNELAYASGAITSMQLSVSGNILIPQNAVNGLTRMRVALKWGLTDISACGPYPYGEVEDYCVNITDYSSGIFTETENHFVTVYPNPLTDFLTFQKHFDYELPFSIIDCNGRKVYSSVLRNDIQTIDLSELAAGMYFLKAGNQVLKLVKR